MRSIGIGAVALLACVFLFPEESPGQGKKGKKGGGAQTALAQDYAQLAGVKEVRGKLTTGVGANSISFDVDISHAEPNPNFKPGAGGFRPGAGGNNNLNLMRQMQNLQNQQAQLARIRDPRQRQQRMRQLQQQMARMQQQIRQAMAKQQQQQFKGKANPGNQNGPFRMVTVTKEFQLELNDNVVVRWSQPPTEYDDKGFLKKYTKEELAKMKGKDSSLPGYEAKVDDLQPGQLVHLYLKAPAKTEAKKKIDLIGDDDLPVDGPRPSVRMIVILQEAPNPTFAAPAKGKKNKK